MLEERSEGSGEEHSSRPYRIMHNSRNTFLHLMDHAPILCEEASIPYVYVRSTEDLASAGATKRPPRCVLVLTKPTKRELGKEDQDKLRADYDQVVSDVSELASSLF